MSSLKRLSIVMALLTATATPTLAGELQLAIANGRVTLTAKDVTVRDILAEWARVGQTRIVNGEKLTGPPVTLQLVDVPEAQALDSLLRTAAGYVMAPRSVGVAGASVYDRIMILATSRPPASPVNTMLPPRQMSMPLQQQQMGLPNPDDEQEAEAARITNMMNVNGIPGAAPGAGLAPGAVPQPVIQMPPPQAPLTSPRPGILPPVQTAPVIMQNPYFQGVLPNQSPYGAAPGIPGQVPPTTAAVPIYPYPPPPQPATRPGTTTGRGGGH